MSENLNTSWETALNDAASGISSAQPPFNRTEARVSCNFLLIKCITI